MTLAAASGLGAVGERVRIGTKEDEREERRRTDEDDGEEVGAGSSAGNPSARRRPPPKPTRFGPTTAPKVAPQTTSPIADARRASG